MSLNLNGKNNLSLKIFFTSVKRYILDKCWLKYNKTIVYVCPFDKEIPSISTKVPIEVRILTKEDIEQGIHYQMIQNTISLKLLKKVSRPVYIKIYTRHVDNIIQRFEQKNICYIAINDERVAGYMWVLFTKNYEPNIGRIEIFKEKEALLNSLYVLPEFRKNSIARKLYEVSLSWLKTYNYDKAYNYVDINNQHAIKILQEMGFIPAKMITSIRFFNFIKIYERILY